MVEITGDLLKHKIMNIFFYRASLPLFFLIIINMVAHWRSNQRLRSREASSVGSESRLSEHREIVVIDRIHHGGISSLFAAP